MKILIVIDMQNDFINGSLGTKEAEAIYKPVLEKIKNHDGIVIYTRDTHDKDYLKTAEGKILPVEHCILGTDGWEIPSELLNAGDNKEPKDYLKRIYNKPTFGCVELAEDLRNLYADKLDEEFSIELIGLCTDICVVSNALLLKAFMPAINISVDSKCCAGVTPETHNNALETMKMCQINVK